MITFKRNQVLAQGSTTVFSTTSYSDPCNNAVILNNSNADVSKLWSCSPYSYVNTIPYNYVAFGVGKILPNYCPTWGCVNPRFILWSPDSKLNFYSHT